MFAAARALFRVQQSLPRRVGGRCPVSIPSCSLAMHLRVVHRWSFGFHCKVRRVASVRFSCTIYSWRLTRYGDLLVYAGSQLGQRPVRDCRSGSLVTLTGGHLLLVRNPERRVAYHQICAACVSSPSRTVCARTNSGTLVIDYLGDTFLEYEIAWPEVRFRHGRL